MAKILKYPGCDREIRTGKTQDLNKHMNLNRNLRKGQCLPALHLIQNPVPLLKWLSKPGIKNNKKIRSKPIPKTDEEWFDLMESNDDNKSSEPSDSEYDTADKDPDIYFEKIVDLYINRILEAEKFNKGEVCDYYASVLKEYFAEGKNCIISTYEENYARISRANIKNKQNTIEIIREDRINATEDVFLEISAFRPLQSSSYLPLLEALDKPQLGIINPQNRDDNECFKWYISAYHTREEAIKANRKLPHLNEIWRLR
ncbi:6904_t:CDS:2 [Dentiscutata erythropus]|uniref:6904_t:CDS:1 n=1 Tax=Dentiscutata erythropus TaxID=1348616 RepID=A0A9N9P0F2_9GLOM|nr:6904_t:CDS:2 [Dentiscutata erythropus]